MSTAPAKAALDVLLRELLNEHPLRLNVTGSSMMPTLSPGQQLALRRPGRLLPGDVVVFRAGGSGPLVAHRLLGVYPWPSGWRLVTQGDSRETPDGAVSRGAVVAEALVSVSLAERLLSFARFLRWGVRRCLRKRG